MTATAYLPPPPAVPVTRLPREQVRSLAHIYGHHRRHANYRFCALLPVVVRDRIHLDDGCPDPYEWAARFGGMTRPEVDRILRLWRQIGHFDCLWRLLGDGVGLSKLERVAPHATEENAEWLAEQVKRLSKAELEELLRFIRCRASANGLAPARAERRLATDARCVPSVPQTESEGPSVPSPGGAPSVLETRGQVPSGPPSGGAPPMSETGGEVPSVPTPGGAPSTSQTASEVPSGPPPGGAPSVLETRGQAPSGPPPGGAPPVLQKALASQEREEEPGGPAARQGQAFEMDFAGAIQGWPDVEPFGRTVCRLSLEIDAVGEKRIRDLQEMYERLHGEPIGLGQLVTLLASWAILRGELPSWQAIKAVESGIESDDTPSEHSDAPKQRDAIEPMDAPEQGDGIEQMDAPEQGDGIEQMNAPEQVDEIEQTDAPEQGDAIEQKDAPEQRDAIEQTDAPEQGDAIEQMDAPEQRDAIEQMDAPEQGEKREQGPSTELRSAHGSEPGRAAREGQRDQGGSARVEAKPAGPGRAVPARKFQPRLLEVVVSIAETGWRFIRTRLGWVPVGDGAVAGFLAPGQPVPLENLRMAAIVAAGRVTGKRHRPVAVDRYLFARSGGYCEVRGCNRRAVAAHHRKRFAFDPSHHPDALVCVCHAHHGLAHKGLIQDEDRDPAGWELLRVGEEPTLLEPDRKLLAYRGSP